MQRPPSPPGSPASPARGTLASTLIENDDESDDSTGLWLTVVEKTGSRLLPLPGTGQLRIGRAENSDIILLSPSVSRDHAVLVIRNGGVLLQDSGSANGSRVGRKRIPPSGQEPVPPGVAVLLGGASLVVHQLGSMAASAYLSQKEFCRTHEVILAGEHIQALRKGALAEDATHPPMGKIVVDDGSMKKLFQLVDRIAPGTISVLLLGETGVGKEVVAAAIHERSPRKGRSYLRLNCSAFAENLLESELFGHEAGAFTGARTAKPGLLETADGGTILLDEIGEMPLPIQAKLLRVIETREVIPIGGTKVRKLDVRFLAATNRDLQEQIRTGAFREDLYFRLSGVTLVVPPLRDRPCEIAPMAQQFAAEAASALGREMCPSLSRSAIQFLEKQSWPGNVRELRNCMERAVLLASSDILTEDDVDPLQDRFASDLPRKPTPSPSGRKSISTQTDERERIVAALSACAGNQTRAAALLGIARRTLVKKLAALGLPRPRQ